MAVVSWRALCILPLLFVSGSSTLFWPFFGNGNPFYNPNPTPVGSSSKEDYASTNDVDLQNPEYADSYFADHVSSGNQFGVDVASKKGKKGNGGSAAKTNYPGKWELFSQSSGVSAMHAILLPKINKVLMYDATIWRVSGIKLPAGVPCHVVNEATKEVDCWAHSVLFDIETAGLRPLRLNTDTWCSSGGLSENGTLVGTGGFEKGANTARYLLDCDTCDWVEYPNALAAPRWYSTQVTLPDGNFIVVGGRGAMNYEYIPQEGVKNTKLIDSPLLQETTDKQENNLYPFVYLSTDGNLFIFANDRSILLDPKTNQVIREFPKLPGGARNYPASGMSVLLPIKLHAQNGPVISADVLVCGGAQKDAYDLAGKQTFLPAFQDCGRITITSQNPRWKKEMMPSPRILGDAVILPTGDVLFVNGAKKGSAGWNLAKEPNFAPVLYGPDSPKESRFKELAASNIPRMYHSSSVLLPDGKILIAGSNTNNGYVYNNTEFPTELRVEKFSPPYLDPALANLKPEIVKGSTDQKLSYGKHFNVQIHSNNPVTLKDLRVTMYAPAFTTHGISMNQRLLILGLVEVTNSVASGIQNIVAVAPPSGKIAPPGYYLLYVVYRGVPSAGVWVHIS